MNTELNTGMIIRKVDNQTMDLYNEADAKRGMRSAQNQRRNAGKADRVAELLVGIAGDRITGSQKEVMEELGFAPKEQSQASKSMAVAKAFRQVAYADRAEGLSDSKLENLGRNVGYLAAYWDFAHQDMDGGQAFVDHCKALTGDDGAERAKVVPTHLSVFPSVSYAYDVARGAKFHPSDPRADEKVDETDETGRQDKTLDELLAELEALAGRCLRAGASVTDVVARVNTAAKAGQQADAA